jgi:hypothetical protein
MARLRGDDEMLLLMQELSSQQGYPSGETATTKELTEASHRRIRLLPEKDGYPSVRPAGDMIWNPYVKAEVESARASTSSIVPTNPQVEILRRRAYERFKTDFRNILQRTSGTPQASNRSEGGAENLWEDLAIVAMMERWHFSVKLGEQLGASRETTGGKICCCSLCPTTEIHAIINRAVGEKNWIDPVLISYPENNQKSRDGIRLPQVNLLLEEVKFEWTRSWRRKVQGRHRDEELKQVFDSKKFKKKITGVSQALKSAAISVSKYFQNELAKRASLEEMKTKIKSITLPKISSGDKEITVTYSGLTFSLNHEHLEKLKILFDRHNQSRNHAEHEAAFACELFVLLARYDTLQGAGLQSALPGLVFDTLLKMFDCCIECFASPLNCRYESFLSAFPDTDLSFGSLGSFFDFDFSQGGSYQANPPFTSIFIEAMHRKMVHSLDQCKEPLMFIIFVPEWKDSPGWQALKRSNYLQHYFSVEQASHSYAEGSQHRRKGKFRIASFDTSVFFLQNYQGKMKWPIHEHQIKEIMDAFAQVPLPRDSVDKRSRSFVMDFKNKKGKRQKT